MADDFVEGGRECEASAIVVLWTRACTLGFPSHLHWIGLDLFLFFSFLVPVPIYSAMIRVCGRYYCCAFARRSDARTVYLRSWNIDGVKLTSVLNSMTPSGIESRTRRSSANFAKAWGGVSTSNWAAHVKGLAAISKRADALEKANLNLQQENATLRDDLKALLVRIARLELAPPRPLGARPVSPQRPAASRVAQPPQRRQSPQLTELNTVPSPMAALYRLPRSPNAHAQPRFPRGSSVLALSQSQQRPA
ncbi:hypothetical protein B0H13DRAFT_1930256 [Mycena leptocephala]|nr:hypothetical protein B0H13DRAFT_1930256 [Mycena leptocephala]